MAWKSRLGWMAAAVLAMGVGAAAAQGYDQQYRPQEHFSPLRNWTNDPNGLVFFKGEYHLFFQYNPFGDEWGHMSWGHGVSRDLLHWKELPVALPEADGVMIFTGSVVVDARNTSGFCKAGPCLVAVYTGHRPAPKDADVRQTQNLAYSVDDGRTWTKFSGNPVLDLDMADFRDPSVSWDAATQRWVMAVSLPKEHKVRFYASANLREWSQLSDFGPLGDTDGDWECPDLLHIPAEKAGGAGMWALKVGLNPGAPQGGSGEQYFLGSFDGKAFTVSGQRGAHGWTNYGKDDYCAISFNGLPKSEKPVLIGWMNNWEYASKLPTAPWRGQMSLPRRLSLVEDADGLAVRQEPVTAPLRGAAQAIAAKSGDALNLAEAGPFEAQMRFTPGAEAVFGVRLYSDAEHWTEVGFDRSAGVFYVDRTHAGAVVTAQFPVRTTAPLAAGRSMDVHLVVDRASVETYAQDGTIAMTDLIFPATQTTKVVLFGGAAATGQAWPLKSIWH